MSTITELHEVQYEILTKVKSICEKHSISYYLCGGTLLGAVRHQGFIPWDDDIDICFPYSDYNRFLLIAGDELEPDYYLKNTDTDKYDFRSFSRVTKRNTAFIEKRNLTYPGNQEIFIDCFPLVSIDDGLELKLKKVCLRISNLILEKELISSWNNNPEVRKWLGEYYGKFFLTILKIIYLSPRLFRKKIHDMLLRYVYSGKDSDPYYAEIWGVITELYPKEIFDGKPEKLKFEEGFFPVPPQYHAYLSLQYGDYMTPPRENKRKRIVNDLIIDTRMSYKYYVETVCKNDINRY